MKKAIIFIYILILFIYFLNGQTINKIVFDYKEKGFYRSITDLIKAGDKIIIADFFTGRVYCFKYMRGKAEFLYEIGQPGQGPGDIERPFELSGDDDLLAIRDQQGISLFQIDGKYLNKFKLFSSHIAFILIKNRIYYLSANLIGNHLIDVFNLDGKIISQIGEKNIWRKGVMLDNINAFRELLIYEGFLLTEGSYLYYINNAFGFIDKYSLGGKFIKRIDLSKNLDDNSQYKIHLNKQNLIQTKNLKLEKGRAGVKYLFLDAYVDNGYLYLLMDQHDAINNKPTNLIDIKKIDLNSFKLSSFFSAKLYNKEKLSHIVIETINDNLLVLFDVDSEDGLNLCEIYLSK